MLIQPYELDALTFAWCHRVYYRWRTHRRQPHPRLAALDQSVLASLVQPYGVHVLWQPSAEAVCDCWRKLQTSRRMVIDKVSFLPDHVHVALALHPAASPAEIVVGMMNAAQETMWAAFADDVVRAGVERLWQCSAYIGSFGELSSNAISAYVERWERG